MTHWQSVRPYRPAQAALNPVVLLTSLAIAAAVPLLLLASFAPVVWGMTWQTALALSGALAMSSYWPRTPPRRALRLGPCGGAADRLCGRHAHWPEQILYFVDPTLMITATTARPGFRQLLVQSVQVSCDVGPEQQRAA
jgi:hypothetical protein